MRSAEQQINNLCTLITARRPSLPFHPFRNHVSHHQLIPWHFVGRISFFEEVLKLYKILNYRENPFRVLREKRFDTPRYLLRRCRLRLHLYYKLFFFFLCFLESSARQLLNWFVIGINFFSVNLWTSFHSNLKLSHEYIFIYLFFCYMLITRSKKLTVINYAVLLNFYSLLNRIRRSKRHFPQTKEILGQ